MHPTAAEFCRYDIDEMVEHDAMNCCAATTMTARSATDNWNLVGRWLFIAIAAILSCGVSSAQDPEHTASRPPNIILILADDLGYGDLGCYGNTSIATPHLDRMAAEGLRFTSFYAASSVCSASRAALLTGCYPQRVSIPGVISANVTYGIHPDEQLLPEILRSNGYSTAIFGKWHLGNQPQFNPLNHGFDKWLGTVGSNDMGRGRLTLAARAGGKAGVELFRNRSLIETNPDQRFLTQRYTDEAIRFIQEQKAKPFFLYVPHNMPHTPLFVSPEFAGKSAARLYGDVVSELDASVGRILQTLDDLDIADQTIVVFTSDNGPWLIFGDHGGSAGPFRGGKKQTFEGGQRVPCLVRWPGKIQPRTVDIPTVAFDLLPTLVALAGTTLPSKKIDGIDLSALWLNGTEPAERSIAFYFENELRAIRRGPWKLQFAHTDRHAPDPERKGHGGHRGAVVPIQRSRSLYNLKQDVAESRPVAATDNAIMNQLLRDAESFRDELGDSLQKRNGHGVRPAGQVPVKSQREGSSK